MTSHRNRAIFLDKDGTLVKDIPYNVDPVKMEFYPEAAGALRLMAAYGFVFIVVSNQPGVAKGYFGEAELIEVASTLRRFFDNHGIELSGFYYCPHHPKGTIDAYSFGCQCRKPNPGLIFKAARDFDVELSESWMIGDILNDVEAGNRAGCRTIMLDRKNETEWLIDRWRKPGFVVADMYEAAGHIIGSKRADGAGRAIL